MKNLLKSFGAVFAGFLVIVILSVGTDQILDPIPLWFALLYRTVYAVMGGYVTAMLAPYKPAMHVAVLTGIGTVLGTLGAIGNWNVSPEHWYPIALVIFSFFAVLGGGKLKMKQGGK